MKFSKREEIRDIMSVLESLNKLVNTEILKKDDKEEFIEKMVSGRAIPKITVSAVGKILFCQQKYVI